MLRRTGVLQIDSVNVLARAHYLPLFSRLGPYPTQLLDQAAYRAPRSLFEYWGHEASLLPVELHPLLRWRMAEAADASWGGMQRVAKEQPQLVADVLAEIALHGPMSAGELEKAHHGERVGKKGPWWDWSHVKRAVEYLFWAGEVTTASRRGFERLYDLPERVLPAEILALPTPSKEEAQRALLLKAASALGVATARDLRDYFRLDASLARIRLGELVDEGLLHPVDVEGWRPVAYTTPDFAVPRRADVRSLLAPFDPLIWERDRVERLFGFRYRIEIYVPAEKRVHGYYVLPFLWGDRLVARVDLKADRAAGSLLVQAAWKEADLSADAVIGLVEELRSMAGWLGLERIVVTGAGDLGAALRKAVKSVP